MVCTINTCFVETHLGQYLWNDLPQYEVAHFDAKYQGCLSAYMLFNRGTCLQVLMADSAEAQQLEAAADTDLLARHANMPRHAVPSSTAPAATAPAGPNPQAGSHALRIAANPNLAGPAPMFIKQPMQQLAQPPQTNARSALSESNATLSYSGVQSVNTPANDNTEEQEGEDDSGSSSRRTKAVYQNRNLTRMNRNHIPRLQHDDPFLAYDHDITVA